TVQFVHNHNDPGPFILQKAVPVQHDDTPDTLADRVQTVEREAYPEAIELFAQGRLRVEDGKVRVSRRAN
ncbi:MAG: formyltransferase family protein, partial [Gemmataceae bacterium]